MRRRSATGAPDGNPRRVITAGTSRLEARQPGLRFRFRWDFHVKVPLRPPTPPALRAHPPPPPGGEGSHGDTRWKAVPGGGTGGGFPGEEGSASPDPAPPRALPVQWTVVAIATRGWGPGRGARASPLRELRQQPYRPAFTNVCGTVPLVRAAGWGPGPREALRRRVRRPPGATIQGSRF